MNSKHKKKKIIRVTTVPASLLGLLKGQLGFMSKYYDVLGVSSKGKLDLLSKLKERENVRYYPIEMTRKITPIRDLKALWKLYRLFKKEKPFIVHSHTPKAGTLSMIAAKMAKVPHRLHTIAGLPLLETTGSKRKLLNVVEKITYRCATKIYPNSFGLMNIILNNNFTKKNKLRVINNGSSNGIDTFFFDPKLPLIEKQKKILQQKYKIQKQHYIYLFVGRLVSDKGINELIEAFNKLNEEFKNTKLFLVGPFEDELDPLSNKTHNLITSNPNIITTGWIDDVRPYYSIANALTFPSYREGFPNVVMQAGAMELPSIVTDINGCNEIIKDNETGLIIPVKNVQALYQGMKLFLKEQDKAKIMGINSRAYIVNNFQRESFWKALLEEYNQLS